MNVTPSMVRILIGLSLTGITTTLLYLLLRKDDEDIDDTYEGIKTSRPATIEVKIPKASVGVVIGRGGNNIKDIQERSDTKINFKDEQGDEDFRICVIRGTPETAQLAESLIHEFISNQPLIEISEMLVPQKACGRIIGRNGENIRSISRASSAKITVEGIPSNGRESVYAERRVIIKGTIEQIELAKALIKEKVEEDEDIRKKLEESLANRSPRKKDRSNYLLAGDDNQVQEPERYPAERLIPTGSDGMMEVYVSALLSPSCFWLQVICPRAVELDHLVDQMTEYYSNDENRELHVIKEVSAGQIVAAPFSYDDNWYRAEVTEIEEDEYDPMATKVTVTFVDYGDVEKVKRKDVMELRTDFLRLRFQAIECSLAKIVPKGGKWSEEAIDLFEELTHAAQWVALMARVDSYKERQPGQGRREGSPVPSVELFESRNCQDISIAEELVKQGFAEWEKTSLAINGDSSKSSGVEAVACDSQPAVGSDTQQDQSHGDDTEGEGMSNSNITNGKIEEKDGIQSKKHHERGDDDIANECPSEMRIVPEWSEESSDDMEMG